MLTVSSNCGRQTPHLFNFYQFRLTHPLIIAIKFVTGGEGSILRAVQRFLYWNFGEYFPRLTSWAMRAFIGSDATPGRPLRLYTQDHRRMDMSTETIVGLKKNTFKNWLCGAGVQSIYVDMDGKIFVASCRVGGEIGNIYQDLKVPQAWITCPLDFCSCGSDLVIPKAKTQDAKMFLIHTFQNSAKIKNISQQASANDDFVAIERTYWPYNKLVYWELGRYCNYDCSYCWPFIHNKTDPHKSLKDLISATQLIETQFIKGEKGCFIISGGEPTLNPALLDWVKYIKSMGHTVSMHSNGSRLASYYLDLIEHTDLNISVHFEFYKKDKLIDVIEAITLKKIEKKNKNLGHLEVKLMMPPGFTDQALAFEQDLLKIDQFKNYNTWAIVPIRDGDRGDLIKQGYTETDFKLFGDRV